MSRVIRPPTVASDGKRNLVAGFGPDEGFGHLVIRLEIAANGDFKFPSRVEVVSIKLSFRRGLQTPDRPARTISPR